MTIASNHVGTQREVVQMGAVQMESLGRVGSQRGIQLLAVNGMLNQRLENDITTSIRLFSYVTRIADGSEMSINRQPFQATRPLNFVAPGVRWATKGSVTGVVCIFSAKFMAHLTEIERDFHFSEIDVLTAIDSRRLIQLGQAMKHNGFCPRPIFRSTTSLGELLSRVLARSQQHFGPYLVSAPPIFGV